MIDHITTNYRGEDATLDILIMLLVSAALGWMLHWLYATVWVSGKTKRPKKELAQKDDLKVIEGVGPKIENMLGEAGIYTWKDLSKTPVSKLQKILNLAGKNYSMHDPSSWPKQAELAASGKWEQLKGLQSYLEQGKG